MNLADYFKEYRDVFHLVGMMYVLAFILVSVVSLLFNFATLLICLLFSWYVDVRIEIGFICFRRVCSDLDRSVIYHEQVSRKEW